MLHVSCARFLPAHAPRTQRTRAPDQKNLTPDRVRQERYNGRCVQAICARYFVGEVAHIMTDTALLSERIRTYAKEIGFSLVGFAPADDFDEFLEVINNSEDRYTWWKEGLREPLEWARPTQKVPGTKSLIVLVFDYAQKQFPPELCEKVGRIYQSRSYVPRPGNVNFARLDLMHTFLAEQGIASTDALWLPQRWAGVRAGLTSFGKNTFAFAPRLGSFIVLNTFLVDVELEYDQPGPTCTCPENCTLCIDACPTGAIIEPFKLEPRKCIAFNNWMPGAATIPREIRPLIGQRIHGCDACQEACPRNKGVIESNKKRSYDSLLEIEKKELTLEQLLHLSPEYYELRVRPIMYNYIQNMSFFQRNAAVAMGNTHDARYIPDLAEELDNENELVRAHVAWALGEIGGQEAERLLKKRLEGEEDESVREEISLALA